MIGVTILGSTGTIGINTLDVIEQHRDRFRVVALTANTDVDRLAEQCRKWRPAYAAMSNLDSAHQLHQRLKADNIAIEVAAGPEGLEQLACLPESHYVMAGIVGAAGLLPTLAAARAGKRVMLANKEALVMSGKLFMDAVSNHGAELLPIDSEHNAIFQCLPADFSGGVGRSGIKRILLTASGGPFRTLSRAQMLQVTPEQACAHPNWVMGRKISVDSATMMNKGLEIIEACWLFHLDESDIQVVIHRQSVIHSLVEYLDGSLLAQLGNPDMRTPIAYALGWPERIHSGVESLDLLAVARLDFEPPDDRRFPCLRLAREAIGAGGTATAILNAANEIAVEAFLQRRISFPQISQVIDTTLEKLPIKSAESLDSVIQDDVLARECATALIGRLH